MEIIFWTYLVPNIKVHKTNLFYTTFDFSLLKHKTNDELHKNEIGYIFEHDLQ